MRPRTAVEDVRGGRVEVRGLTWRPYGRAEPILRDLDLDLPPGERVLLVGPSGAGKSTLLRALAGALETADAGELTGTVTVDGVAPGARAGAVGLVLQEPGAGVVAATVGRDVAFGLENTAVPREQMPATVEAALRAVGLGMPTTTPTHALSGGETQRLALAGALALAPSLLLLDEPTAMLDPANAAAVRDCVDRVTRERGLTTVVVEHRLGPWVDLVDRLVVLDASGAVVADGEPTRVLADHAEQLVAQGVWVPGVPDPEPVHPDGVTFGDARLGHLEVALRATGVRVERVVTRLDGSRRTSVAADPATTDATPHPTTPDVIARAGQVLALTGPSGCGKSSLLLALAGLHPVARGTVRAHRALAPGAGAAPAPDTDHLDPASWDSVTTARALAWVPQWASSTIVAGTVLDEVLATPTAVGTSELEATARARALLAALGLAHLEQADPRTLSGGEQRRLAMAAAVVHQPSALLADEPTVGQDRHTWAAVLGLVEAVRDAGSAVVVTTHDDAVIARADRHQPMVCPAQPPEPPSRRRPLASRAGPLALLLGSAVAIPAGVLAPGWREGLLVLAVQAVLTVVALLAPGEGPPPRGRLRRLAVRYLPGVVGALSVGWSTWLLGGHDLDLAAQAVVRVLVIVLPSAVLIPFVDPDALADQGAQRLRLPARPVVAASAALQRVHTLGDTWAEIARARRVRGIGVTRNPVTVFRQLGALTTGMLVRSLQSAAALAVAMDARGFATAYRRTWAQPAPWRLPDTALTLLSLLPLVVAAALAAASG